MTKAIVPKCLNDEGDHFVSVDGYWHPCCAVGGKNKEYFSREPFHVSNGIDFHKNILFLQWVDNNLKTYTHAPGYCKKRCGSDYKDGNKFYRSADEAEFFFPENSTS